MAHAPKCQCVRLSLKMNPTRMQHNRSRQLSNRTKHFPHLNINFPVTRVHIQPIFADTAVVQCRPHTKHYRRARIRLHCLLSFSNRFYFCAINFQFPFGRNQHHDFCAAKFLISALISLAGKLPDIIETSHNSTHKQKLDKRNEFHFINSLNLHISLRATVESSGKYSEHRH